MFLGKCAITNVIAVFFNVQKTIESWASLIPYSISSRYQCSGNFGSTLRPFLCFVWLSVMFVTQGAIQKRYRSHFSDSPMTGLQ